MKESYDLDEAIEDTRMSIPRHFRWATFGDELRKRLGMYDCDAALIKCDDAKTMVLLGKAGTGKTSLGCALLRRKSEKLVKSGRFTDAIDLAYARRMHPLGEGEAPAIRAAMEAPVLFLDELGAEQGIDQTIEQIIRTRHNRDLPTIYATAFSPAELRARYGDGVSRRVFEGAEVIELGKGEPSLAKMRNEAREAKIGGGRS